MKNSSNKTKDSGTIRYMHLRQGDGVPLKTLCGSKELLLSNFAIWWPTTLKAGLNSMKTKQ